MNFKEHFQMINRSVLDKRSKGKLVSKFDLYSYASTGIQTHKNLYKALPNFKTQEGLWEFFTTHLPEGYKVGAFNIKLQDIYAVFSPLDVTAFAIEFFEEYRENFDREDIFKRLEYKVDKVLNLPSSSHYFKLAQLARIYIKEELKFKYPPTANKILDLPKYFLHPGGFRQLIYHLFSEKEEVEVVGLIPPDVQSTKIFEKISDLLEHFNLDPETTQLELSLHGFENLLLPQFAFGYEEYHSGLLPEFKIFLESLDKMNIYTNFLFNHRSIDQEKVITEFYIELENIDDPITILKVFLLLPLLTTEDKSLFEKLPGVILRELKPIATKN